jgi:ribonuclease-3
MCELYDIQWKPLNNNDNSTCTCYHFFPRFARTLPDNGKELLHPAEQMQYFLKHLKPLMPNDLHSRCKSMSVDAWDKYVSKVQGSIVWFPKHRPAAIRLDQLDRENSSYPVIVHFGRKIILVKYIFKISFFLGIRPAVLSIQYNQEYRQAYKSYLKVFFLLKNRTPTDEDKANLRDKEQRLKQIVAKHAEQLKREIVVEISSEYAYRTGLKSDIIQYSLLLSSLHDHLRFHQSLTELENQLVGYQFRNRWLMQLALTHPSGNYVLHNNLGPNPDHVKNTLVKEFVFFWAFELSLFCI